MFLFIFTRGAAGIDTCQSEMSAVTGDRLQGFRGERRGSMPMGRLGWEGRWGMVGGGRDKEDMVMRVGGL